MVTHKCCESWLRVQSQAQSQAATNLRRSSTVGIQSFPPQLPPSVADVQGFGDGTRWCALGTLYTSIYYIGMHKLAQSGLQPVFT